MWPRIGPVASFGVLYLVGITLHFVLSWRIAKRHKLPRRVWLAVSICYMFAMVVGAKLLYDVRHSQLSISALLQAEHWLGGGLWGGLLAYFAPAVPAVMLLAARRRAGLDLVALTIPIPWIAAKLGCFLNGCCHGRPCSLPWAVTDFLRGDTQGPLCLGLLSLTQLLSVVGAAAAPILLIAHARNTDRGVELPKGA